MGMLKWAEQVIYLQQSLQSCFFTVLDRKSEFPCKEYFSECVISWSLITGPLTCRITKLIDFECLNIDLSLYVYACVYMYACVYLLFLITAVAEAATNITWLRWCCCNEHYPGSKLLTTSCNRRVLFQKYDYGLSSNPFRNCKWAKFCP